ncbi:hypothetical protein BX616_006620 [Lobosporangium transversale]|nr:hypothetical protein BX616_006620 [Lobosporangium transversale]
MYAKSPTPFTSRDLSESFWARSSWPLLKELFDDVSEIIMIDGEKAGLESKIRRNKSRRTESDASTRRRIGRKLDLVARNYLRKEDWFIVQFMNEWNPKAPKFLVEANVHLFRELHNIMVHRLQQAKNDDFQTRARFFSIYAGDRGFRTLELRAAGSRTYVALCKIHKCYSLPPFYDNLSKQFQSLTHILQLRACASETIYLYQQVLRNPYGLNESDDWLYENSNVSLDDETLASSP